jgi:hypothetical protein
MNTTSTNRVDGQQLALYQQRGRARTKLRDHKLFNKRVEHEAKLICWYTVHPPQMRVPVAVIAVGPADGIGILKREGSGVVLTQLDHRARASGKRLASTKSNE